MSNEQMKEQINQVLDKMSDRSLADLLSFLKNIETKKPSLFSSDMLDKVLAEDKELLEKLAQ